MQLYIQNIGIFLTYIHHYSSSNKKSSIGSWIASALRITSKSELLHPWHGIFHRTPTPSASTQRESTIFTPPLGRRPRVLDWEVMGNCHHHHPDLKPLNGKWLVIPFSVMLFHPKQIQGTHMPSNYQRTSTPTLRYLVASSQRLGGDAHIVLLMAKNFPLFRALTNHRIHG